MRCPHTSPLCFSSINASWECGQSRLDKHTTVIFFVGGDEGLRYIHRESVGKEQVASICASNCSHDVANTSIYKYQTFGSHTISGNTTLERLGMCNLERHKRTNLISCFHSFYIVCCLFSRRYNPLWLYFHSPLAGFGLLVCEVS